MSEQEQKRIFSRNLTKLLNENDKTQREVADAIHVSYQTFNTWVKGIAIPRMGKIQALADYFHIRKSDLLDENKQDDEMSMLTKYLQDPAIKQLVLYAGGLMPKDDRDKFIAAFINASEILRGGQHGNL